MALKILLFGSNGQVGTELNPILANIGELISINRDLVDLTSETDIRHCIQENQPQFIVNAAAYTAVDKAESESELAFQINAIAPSIIAEESNKIKAQFIYISTDYVFSGKSNKPYLESDLVNPLGVYGKSKLEGEENIRKNCDNYIILRTAWVYGKYGKGNFAKTMLRVGGERETLKVVMDQIGCPTYAEDIALIIGKIIEQNQGEKSCQETYHFSNLGVCSWYDFAVNIFRQARKLGYSLTVKEIIPIATEEYPTLAQRPAYSVLNTAKIRNDYNITGNYWLDSLERYFQ